MNDDHKQLCLQAVAAMSAHPGKNFSEVARLVNINPRTFHDRLKAGWQRYGAAPGVPAIPVPEGTLLGKTTLYVDEDGVVKGAWARTHPTMQAMEEAMVALEGRAADAARKAIAPPKKSLPQAFLNEIIIGDPHAGMYAWGDETGTDYDLDIFHRLHTEGPKMLLQRMGDSSRVVLAFMGDLFHADNHKTTERSGNILDVDGRIGKVMDVTIDALCTCIDYAAKVASEVQVVLLTGNHDRVSSQWAQRVMSAYYRHSTHVGIVANVRNRIYLDYGHILLGYHHGDKVPANRLQAIMAQEQPDVWGRTRHRYWRCGHIHQTRRYRPNFDTEEAPGCIVEYFPVLAGIEAYASEAGMLSRRAIIGVRHHELYGEIGRSVVTPQMLEG